MKETKITARTRPDKILKIFRDCNINSTVNLQLKNCYIYLAGGILSKLEDHTQYIAMNGKWVKV